jgi:hypothetical protein
MAEGKVHVTMKQTRDEIRDKLHAEHSRHDAAIEVEGAYHTHRVTELESLIAKFDERIKE